jgi:hypothetical protein
MTRLRSFSTSLFDPTRVIPIVYRRCITFDVSRNLWSSGN